MKNMTSRRFKRLGLTEAGDRGSCRGSGDIYFSSTKPESSPSGSSDIYDYKSLAYSGGTLPRNFKKNGGLQKWKPLTLPPEPERKTVVLEKKGDETFGFEIQTYGLHHQDENSVEMCTFVCRVHEGSTAKLAGLKVGDTITSVNETPVEGFRHKEIVQLIKSAGDSVRLETVYSSAIRKAELEARLQYLKQTLHEKWDEYRSLMVQEQRLVHGIVLSDAAVYESLECAGVYGSLGSTASSGSQLSEDDPPYQNGFYYRAEPGDASDGSASLDGHPRPRQRLLRPASELFASARTSLSRSASTRSHVRPDVERRQCDGSGSLRPKPKRQSIRRRLLKYIPGLNRPLEEEESKL